MSFKKLLPCIKENITKFGFENPTTLQKQLIPKIKGGANFIGIAPEGAGKTTNLIINTIQKLNGEAFEDVPRALIFTKDKQAVLALEEEFNKWIKNTDLRIAIAYEEGKIDDQKDAIYVGSDIVIGTPKRLNKIYFQNGLNLANLQLLAIEDAEFLIGTSFHTEIHRIVESLARCQYLVFSNKFDHKIEKLQELYMEDAQVIEIE
jgi:superfamily II DNA/RNA helicase